MCRGRSPEEVELAGETFVGAAKARPSHMTDADFKRLQKAYLEDMVRRGEALLRKHRIADTADNRQALSMAIRKLQDNHDYRQAVAALANKFGPDVVADVFDSATYAWRKHGRYLAEDVARGSRIVGDDMGFWGAIKKALAPAGRVAKNVIATPAGKAAATAFLGPKMAAAAGLAAAVNLAKGGKPKKEIEKSTDKAPPAEVAQAAEKQAALAGDDIGFMLIRVPKSVLTAGQSTTAGYGSVMGADAPMSDAQVMNLIKREPNPLKRERMVINFSRAMGRR
jgi:hypothetical protein